MSIQNYKITDALVELYGVCQLPDVLTGSPLENKKCFDRLVQHGVAPQVNGLIEALPNTHIDYTNYSTGGGWREHDRYFVIYEMFKNGTYIPFASPADANLTEAE